MFQEFLKVRCLFVNLIYFENDSNLKENSGIYLSQVKKQSQAIYGRK
jgi:hypothetical protein